MIFLKTLNMFLDLDDIKFVIIDYIRPFVKKFLFYNKLENGKIKVVIHKKDLLSIERCINFTARNFNEFDSTINEIRKELQQYLVHSVINDNSNKK